jgi:hypothetical protein
MLMADMLPQHVCCCHLHSFSCNLSQSMTPIAAEVLLLLQPMLLVLLVLLLLLLLLLPLFLLLQPTSAGAYSDGCKSPPLQALPNP